MNVLIIDNGSKFTENIAGLFDDANVNSTTFDDPEIHQTPEDTLVVLSGGRKTAIIGHEDVYENEMKFIKNFGGAIIGICLGFELIAHAYGNQLYRMEERRQGAHRISAIGEGQEFLDDETATVYESHRWNVRSVESPLVLLAESVDGVEMLRHESRQLYGVQFHPEVNAGNEGKKIFQRIVERVLDKNEALA